MIAPTRASAAARSPGRSRPSSAHAARGRLGQAEQQPDQRGLAGAVGAEEAEGDAARHLEVDAVERRPGAEPLAEARGLDRERVGSMEGVEGMRRRVRAGRRRRPRADGRNVALPERMNLLGRLIRSDESRSTQRTREPRRPGRGPGALRSQRHSPRRHQRRTARAARARPASRTVWTMPSRGPSRRS